MFWDPGGRLEPARWEQRTTAPYLYPPPSTLWLQRSGTQGAQSHPYFPVLWRLPCQQKRAEMG